MHRDDSPADTATICRSPRARPDEGHYQRAERLEHEITTLAAHIHAATYRLLCLIREFDEGGSWAAGGFMTCAHWLSWKCGIDIVIAREKVRVARKLPEFPRIAAAFERGALSYSKVRAMTRVGTSANEAYLLELGLHGSASHVTSLVGKYRSVQRLAEIEELNERHAERSVWWYYDDDGMLVIEGRLPPEQGAVVVQALQAAVDTLWKAEVKEDHSDQTTKVACARMAPLPFGGVGGDASAASVDNSSIRRERVTARRADGLVLMAETLLSRGAGVPSGGERYQVVMHVDPESLRDDEEDERCELEGGPGIAKPTARRVACDASLVSIEEDADGTPLNIGRKTRTVPPAIRRALRSRDRGCPSLDASITDTWMLITCAIGPMGERRV